MAMVIGRRQYLERLAAKKALVARSLLATYRSARNMRLSYYHLLASPASRNLSLDLCRLLRNIVLAGRETRLLKPVENNVTCRHRARRGHTSPSYSCTAPLALAPLSRIHLALRIHGSGCSAMAHRAWLKRRWTARLPAGRGRATTHKTLVAAKTSSLRLRLSISGGVISRHRGRHTPSGRRPRRGEKARKHKEYQCRPPAPTYLRRAHARKRQRLLRILRAA